jgi:hypothetical protein
MEIGTWKTKGRCLQGFCRRETSGAARNLRTPCKTNERECLVNEFGSGRRQTVYGSSGDRILFLKRLATDARVRTLSGAAQGLLLHAAIVHADGEGKFFHGVDLWASETGRDRKTVRAAVSAAEAVGLLKRTPHMLHGRQTTNTYRFDRSLVEGVNPVAEAQERGDVDG